MIRHFINIILYFLPPTRLFEIRRFLLKLAGVTVANTTSLCGHGWIYGRGILQLGEKTWISPGALFYTHKDAKITIGKNCDIGPNVSLIVGSHIISKDSHRAGIGTANNITIGDGTWIGANVLILDGVKIGKGCVIGAGSVVTKNVVDNCLSAGIPAKKKKYLNENQHE